MLVRLEQLGTLVAVSPAFKWGETQTRRVEVIPTLPLPDWRLAEDLDRTSIFLSLLLAQAEPSLARAALLRLSVNRRVTEAVTAALTLQLRSAVPSQVVAQLDRLSLPAVVAAYVLRPEIRAVLHQYLSHWRFVSAELTGADLLALGLQPGPDFSRWLRGLRAARLDGTAADRNAELALIRVWTQTE